jgi:hypothetical protein
METLNIMAHKLTKDEYNSKFTNSLVQRCFIEPDIHYMKVMDVKNTKVEPKINDSN